MTKEDYLKLIRHAQSKLGQISIKNNYNLQHPDVVEQAKLVDNMVVTYHKMNGDIRK